MRWSLNFDGLTHALTHFLRQIQSTGLKNKQINEAKQSNFFLFEY
jgi:hypothetical protein